MFIIKGKIKEGIAGLLAGAVLCFSLSGILGSLTGQANAQESAEKQIENLEKEIEELEIQVALLDAHIRAIEEVERNLLDFRTKIQSTGYAFRNTYNQINATIRKLDKEIAKLRPLSDLLDAWKKYKDGGKTEEAFIELYKTVKGRPPDRTTLADYTLYEIMIERELRVKTAVQVGPALIELGNLLKEIVGLGFTGCVNAPRTLWQGADELLGILEGGLFSTLKQVSKASKFKTEVKFVAKGALPERMLYQRSVARMTELKLLKQLPIREKREAVLLYIRRFVDPTDYRKVTAGKGGKLAVIALEKINEDLGLEIPEEVLETLKGLAGYFERFRLPVLKYHAEYERRCTEIAEHFTKEANRLQYGVATHEERKILYERALKQREAAVEYKEKLTPLVEGVNERIQDYNRLITKYRERISELRNKKNEIGREVSAKKERIQNLRNRIAAQKDRKRIAEARKQAEEITVSGIALAIHRNRRQLAADDLTAEILNLPREVSFSVGARINNTRIGDLRTARILQKGTGVQIDYGKRRIVGMVPGKVTLQARADGAKSNTAEIEVIKVVDLKYWTGRETYPLHKGFKRGEIDFFVPEEEYLKGEEVWPFTVQTSRVKVTDGSRTYEMPAKARYVYYKKQLPGWSDKGVTWMVKLTPYETEPEKQGKVTIGYLDKDGRLHFERNFSFTTNIVKMEVKLPEENFVERSGSGSILRLVPLGAEFVYQVVVYGSADMSKYRVYWYPQDVEGVVVSNNVSSFRPAGNHRWVAEAKVRFAGEKLHMDKLEEQGFSGSHRLWKNRSGFHMRGAEIRHQEDEEAICQLLGSPYIHPTFPCIENIEIMRRDLKASLLNADFFYPQPPERKRGISIGLGVEFKGVGEKIIVPIRFFNLDSAVQKVLREGPGSTYRVSGPAKQAFMIARSRLMLSDPPARNMGPAEALLHFSLDSFLASKFRIPLSKEIISDALPLRFNRLSVELGDDVYRLTVDGPSDMSSYEAEWWLLGGMVEKKEFKFSGGKWISEMPARRKFVQVTVINFMGEKVGLCKYKDLKVPGPDISKIRDALVELFTAYEREDSEGFLNYVSPDFRSLDNSGKSYSLAQLERSLLDDFRNLAGIEFRVDAEPPLGSHDLARVKMRWSRRATLAVGGQEWLLKQRSSTLVFRYDKGAERYLLTSIQGDDIFGLSAPTGEITIPKGSIVEGKSVTQETTVDEGRMEEPAGADFSGAIGSIKFGKRTILGNLYLFAGIDIDPNTKKSSLNSSGGQTLTLQSPPDGPYTAPARMISAFPDRLVKNWEFTPPSPEGGPGVAINFPPGEQRTIYLKATNGLKIKIVLKVTGDVEDLTLHVLEIREVD